MKIRLNKFMAQSGICSRRKADNLIKSGKVRVNNVTSVELGISVDPQKDKIFVSDQEIKPQSKHEYILLNKPAGYICSHRSFNKQKNIFELLPEKYRKFICVGRLDKNSEGLVLLTNNGDLAQQLTHPKNNHEKEYVVKVNKEIKQQEIKKLTRGFTINSLGFVNAKGVEKSGDDELNIILTMGKKRQIREMLKFLGFEVASLQRIRIGKFKLGKLKAGEFRIVDNIK